MKTTEKFFLEWGGDGPESGNTGASAQVTIDLGEAFNDDEEGHAEQKEFLGKLSDMLREATGADTCQTESSIDEYVKRELAAMDPISRASIEEAMRP